MHDAKLSDVEDSQSKQDNNIQSQPHPIHGISQTNRRNLRHVTHDPWEGERESPIRSLGGMRDSMEESNQNASEAQTMKMESKEKSQDMNSLSGYEKDLTESLCIDAITHFF